MSSNALEVEIEATRRRIKALTAERKAAGDNFEKKSSLSKEIKKLKKSLNGLLNKKSPAETPPDSPSEPPSSAAENYPLKRWEHALSFDVEQTQDWAEFEPPRQTLYHDLRWRTVFADTMHRELAYVSARGPDQQLVGILPLCITRSRLFGHYGCSLPYVNYGGPLGLSPDIEDRMISWLFEQIPAWGLGHVEVRDTRERALKGASTRTDKAAMVLDMSQFNGADDVLSSLSSKVRSQVKKALRQDIDFRWGKTDRVDDFYQVFARNMRDLGTPVYTRQLFHAITEQFVHESHIVVGYYAGEPVSAAFLLEHNGRWEIPWASTLRRANALSANMALYATILTALPERRAVQFDFGRSSVDAPTYRFKKQWGALPHQLYWYYPDSYASASLTTESKKFQLAIAAWQKLPVWLANRLGPGIVENLP